MVKTDERSPCNILAGFIGVASVSVADVLGDLLESRDVIFWGAWRDSENQPDAFTASGAKCGQAKPVGDGGLQDGDGSGFTQARQDQFRFARNDWTRPEFARRENTPAHVA